MVSIRESSREFRRELGIRFGETVELYRVDKGLTRTQICQEIETDLGTLSKYSRGKCCPSLDTAIKLSRYLGFSLDELAEGL